MGLVVHVDRQLVAQVVPDQVLADDGNDHTGGAHVLLDTGVDHAVIGDIAGLGQEHGRLIGHQDFALGVGQRLIGGAVDGLIFADVDVIGFRVHGQVGAVGDVREVLVLAGSQHIDFAELLGFLIGLFRPAAGDDVIGHAVFQQIHGNHGELQGGAALDKEDMIIVGNAHQVPQVLLGLVHNGLEHLGAMAHFHDAHAAAAVVEHLVADLFEHRLRHGGRTGGEVVNTIVHDNRPPESWWCSI